MHLMLKWKSKLGNIYDLGILTKENEKYIFKINQNQLKEAINDGCMGIGNFTLLNEIEESNVLFDFFKYRIVGVDSPKLPDLLKKYKLKEYDDMEILKITKAVSANDRYWVEEIPHIGAVL